MPHIKITKRAVDALSYREGGGQAYYWDTELRGFGLCIGRRTKTYVAQRRSRGRTVRIALGQHGLITPEAARLKAQDYLGAIVRGETPGQAPSNTITLDEARRAYAAARQDLRPKTLGTYVRCVEAYLADWRNLPLAAIDETMVARRHAEIKSGLYASPHKPKDKAALRLYGPTANTVMRVLQAIYNYAKATSKGLPENPVRRLSVAKEWHRERRRSGFIRLADLSDWHTAVSQLSSRTMRDFLLLLLFTGMRRSEALQLRWENVDFSAKTLTVPVTKNGDPLLLPLSDYVHALLRSRSGEAKKSPWVFPGADPAKPFQEPRKAVEKVRSESGLTFILHDLRRTFCTVADSLDLSAYAIKRLVNHRMSSDVTAGYIVTDIERLRAPMQRVTDELLRAIHRQATFANIFPNETASSMNSTPVVSRS